MIELSPETIKPMHYFEPPLINWHTAPRPDTMAEANWESSMRVGMMVVAVMVSSIMTVCGADTPAAEYTKTARLTAKLTVTVTDKPLKDALDAIFDELEKQKHGRLRYELPAGLLTGVPATVSIAAKDEPLAAILAKLLGPVGIRYTVVSAAGDKADGWLRLAKGDVVPASTPPKGPPASADDEKDAQLKFDAAKAAIAANKPDDAKFLLQFIIKKYPTASVTAAASQLLETLKK
jgi:hypothetical protein